MLQISPANASQVEERLQVYVDQKIEGLRSELLALLAKSSGSPHDANKVAVTLAREGDAEKEEPPVLASVEHLDQHDEYVLGESLWDCAVFIGLDCVGPGESSVLFLLIALNIFVQFYFCSILQSSGMLGPPLPTSVLTQLLHFRADVGHKVELATPSGRSLLSQVCEGGSQLHLSGTQVGMYEDLDSIGSGYEGLLLCILALFCWCASTLVEFNSALRYALAIFEKKGPSTRITVRREGGLEVESLSALDIVKVFVLSIVPRSAAAGLVFFMGLFYVSRTIRLADILLSAMSLAFIMEVDELFFTAFVPHRVKSLIANLAPLHLTPQMPTHRQWFQRYNRVMGGSLGVVLRLLVVGVILAGICVWELIPLHWKVDQALDILCSGDRNFVYSINPASGIVNAARGTVPIDSFTAAECAVLQLARPILQENFGWSLPDCGGIELERLNESSALSAAAVLQPQWLYKVVQNSDPEFFPSEFSYVSIMDKDGTEGAAVDAICEDSVSSVYLSALREAVGGEVMSVSTCGDVKPMCNRRNMTKVRALCPVTCECDLWGFTAAGFFKSPHYGCPKQCEVEAVVREQRLATAGLFPLECLDFTNTRYFFPPGQELRPWHLFAASDIDEDGNLTTTEVTLSFLRHTFDEQDWSNLFSFDLDSDGVWDPTEQFFMDWAYENVKVLDSNLDGNLSVAEANVAITGFEFTDVDGDGFITVREMAGHPQALDVIVPPPPTRITIETVRGAVYFLTGVWDYLLNRPNFLQSSRRKVDLLGSYIGLTAEQNEAVFTDLVYGVTFTNWINGRWLLGAGIPHPRGLVWCEFIASWETILLLGVNICEPSDVASVRTMCPQSCSCSAGMKDCPSSCPNTHKMGSADN